MTVRHLLNILAAADAQGFGDSPVLVDIDDTSFAVDHLAVTFTVTYDGEAAEPRLFLVLAE